MKRLAFIVLDALLLCWPTLLNRGAVLVFSDTRSYFVAGRAAMTKAWGMLHFVGAAAGDSSASLETAIQHARAVRSVFYSLVTFIAADLGSLWIAVAVQAVLLAWLLGLLFHMVCPHRPRWHASCFVAVLSLGTTASWVTSNAMPDVFTPISILATIVLTLYWERMRARLRWGLFIVIAASSVMHLTNLPVLVAVITAGALFDHERDGRLRYAYGLGAVTMAFIATLGVSVVGFHQWTLTPNAPPFLLARSLDDGPGKLYLLEHCPQIGLAMCKHLDRLDVGDDDFIWHANGVYSAVSLDEAALLRNEDKRIYLAAALEHPLMQLRAIVKNASQQLALFTLGEYFIPSYAFADPAEPLDQFQLYIRPTEPAWQMYLAIPEYLIVFIGFGICIFDLSKVDTDRQLARLGLMVVIAVVANAVMCSFSMPAPRYEARVIWLVPMVAVLIIQARRDRDEIA